MADADVPVNRPARAASTQASTEAAAALQSVGAEATRDAAGSIAAKEAAARASVTNGNGAANGSAAPGADGARGSVAGRATSPSSAGGDKTGAAAAGDAGSAPAAAEEQKRGSTITAANNGGADATRAATVTDRPASGSVSAGGDVKQAERAPTQQPLAAVAEEPAPARASVSKASPVPPAADQHSAAAPAASNGSATNGNGADLSKAVTPNNGGGTAQTNAALKDRAEKKDQLAGGDKDITKPRPIEDVKRELEQGSRRCTDAWNGKADAFSGLKPDDGTVRYMGFVLLDGDQKAALFHVDGGKTGPAAATAKADDKAFRLLKLSDLVDSKEEVKLMYTSSPIVLASAAGKGEVVKQLVDRFGVDPQHPQTIYTAAYDKEQKKWVVDNSQGRRVSAGEVALANGFEDVAATGGCRMCAGGDCTLM